MAWSRPTDFARMGQFTWHRSPFSNVTAYGVLRWLQGWRDQLASVGETLLPMECGDVLEWDELWHSPDKIES